MADNMSVLTLSILAMFFQFYMFEILKIKYSPNQPIVGVWPISNFKTITSSIIYPIKDN